DRGRACRDRRPEAGRRAERHSDARRVRRQHRARLALAADAQERRRFLRGDRKGGRKGGRARSAQGGAKRQLAHADDGQEQPPGRGADPGLAREAGAGEMNSIRWLVLAVALTAGPASAAEVRVMISAGFFQVYSALAPEFERATGHKLVTTRGPS